MSSDPTTLLQDRSADEKPLIELVWHELREHARRLLRNERKGHTLQPTALVNEVYLRLIDTSTTNGEDKRRFMVLAARCMRRVLIDHARKRKAKRRGGDGDWVRVTMHPEVAHEPGFTIDLLDLAPALERLAELDERAAQVVELRFFGGLTEAETAEVLGVTDRTVRSDWRTARAWLRRELADTEASPEQAPGRPEASSGPEAAPDLNGSADHAEGRDG